VQERGSVQENADVECRKLTEGGIDVLSVEVLMKQPVLLISLEIYAGDNEDP
jgi:hypothetical protein